VGKFMKRRSVIAGGIFEGGFGRKMNAVLRPAVEGPVRLVMEHLRTGPGKDTLTRLDRLERCVLFRAVRGYAVNLLCVEYCVNAMDQPGRGFAG
jgi:hypothetical protein